MRPELYYFSGTGNSLSVAKGIADGLNGSLVSISSVVMKDSISPASDVVGIVFPSYLAQKYGVPLIVETFVTKLINLKGKYVFALCTCGGWEAVNALPTLRHLAGMVKKVGGKLTGEFSIKLPMNNLTYPSPLINQDQKAMFHIAQKKIEHICAKVSQKQRNDYKFAAMVFNMLMMPLYALAGQLYVWHLRKMAKEPKTSKKSFPELIYNSDKSIRVDASCNGCGLCVRICPAHNIELVDKTPQWLHHCQMCMACDEWCPQRAIHHWCKREGKNYRHPEISISDMRSQASMRFL